MNQEYLLVAGWLFKLLGKRVYMWRNHNTGNWLTDVASFFCDKVFYTSKFSYTAKYRKSVQMPVGVDLESINTDKIIERKPHSILFLGRFDASKHPDLVIEALGLLKQRNISFVATFVGGPSDPASSLPQDVALRAKELGIATEVAFVGAVPSTETYQYHRSHIVYVNCAQSGMLDKSLFKTIACKTLPVFVSNDLAEIIGDEYKFVEGDAQDLADHLEKALSLTHEEREKIVTMNYEKAIEKHTLSVLGNRLAEEMGVNMSRKKIRIVFGMNDFLVGGMQRQFSEQIRCFDREKFDIFLITLFEFPGRDDFYNNLPEDLPVYKLSFRGWWNVVAWWQLYQLLRKIRPQIVVSSLFFGNMVFRLLRPFLGYTSIPREHNTYLHKSQLHIFIDRLLSHASYRIVAVSKTVADFTAQQENIPRKKFEVIHNGIDIAKVQKEALTLPENETLRSELGFDATSTIFLNVARLSVQKNHKLLIDGFAQFAKQNPHCVLALVGGGEGQSDLESYARAKGVGEQIRFFGHRNDTTKFYKIAEFFVSASDMEGFSNSYLKALTLGLPLIATLTAGTDEFLVEGYNGYIIQESTPEGVVSALSRIDFSHSEDLKRHARETAERFSLQKTVSQYEKLFEDAMKAIY
jgi:glycosyltransferase involved in cell wall biosynthesis